MSRRTSLLSALALGATLLALPATSDAAPAARAVVGAQTVGDTLFPDQGNGGYDVGHYDLAITYNSGGSIDAVATITATTTGQPLSQFSLDLEGLTVTSVQVDGVAATSSRISTSPKFKLVVNPATPVSGTFTTRVAYTGIPMSHTDPDRSTEGWGTTADGAVFVNEPVGAMTLFPNNNTPRDKATFDVKVTVPALPARKVVSNGRLVGVANRTYHWQQTEQQATYLTLLGIGSFTEYTDEVALNGGRTTPEWSYQDPLADDPADARAQISPILKAIENRYGPYPGVSTGLMVDVSTLTYALETQDRPFFPTSIDQDTLIHEYVHQWFGNSVSPTDWSDVWLNEGPAEFVTSQVNQELYGGAGSEAEWFGTWNSTAATSENWTTPVAGFTDNTKLFGWQVYTRGAMVLEALRSALTTPVFTQVMRTYLERFGGGDASTAEFTALAEEVSGRELTAFFEDWIYDEDKPAWPGTWNLATTSTPATDVARGGSLSYTLTATNTGKVELKDQVATVDVSDLLASATLGTLPAGVTLKDSNLTWKVPSTALGATATVTIPATVRADAPAGAIDVVTRSQTLGATCTACASTVTVRLPELTAATPTITGTARVGEAVTAVPGTWTEGTTFAYQWLRDGVAIAGATASTYAVVAADEAKALSVRVTGTKPDFEPTTRTSDPVTVAPGVLAPTPTPTITGTPRVEQVLTAVAGTWTGGATLSYQWNVAGTPVPGATATTYTPVAADLGKAVTVTVTGVRTSGTTARTSQPVTVTAGVLDPTPTPSINGTPRPGSTLTAVTGTWDSRATLAYQWLRDGTPVAGATTATYVPSGSEVGRALTVSVTGSRPGYTTVVRTSAPVTVTADPTEPEAPVSPTPTIAGTPRVGETLTAVAGDWTGGATLSYQWNVAGAPVVGATTTTYTPVAADRDKAVTVTVTGVRPSGPTARTSAPVTVLVGVFDPTPTPTISGLARVDQTLTATAGTWDPDATLYHQWTRDGRAIAGATEPTYVLRPGDVDHEIRIAVVGARDGYETVVRSSDPVTVALAVQQLRPRPTLSGTAAVGSTLTARPGAHDPGVTIRYRWYVDGRQIAGATGPTLTLKRRHRGLPVHVTTVATKPGYVTVTKNSLARRVR